MSFTRGMAKQIWDIYTMKYYLAIKRNKLLMYISTSIYLKIIVLIERSQTKKAPPIVSHLYKILENANQSIEIGQ